MKLEIPWGRGWGIQTLVKVWIVSGTTECTSFKYKYLKMIEGLNLK